MSHRSPSHIRRREPEGAAAVVHRVSFAAVRLADRLDVFLPSAAICGAGRPGRRRGFRQTGRAALPGRAASPPRSGDPEPRGGHNQGALQIRAASPSRKRRRPTPNRFPNSPRKSSRTTSPAHRRVLEDKTPPPQNAVPYGQEAVACGALFAVRAWAQAAVRPAGRDMRFQPGPGGGGISAAASPWYVDAVRNRVSSNWLQSTVDPAVRFAPRAVVTFDILRNGSRRQRPDVAIQRQRLGGQFGGARDPGFESAEAAAGRIQRQQSIGGVLV